MSVAKIKAPYAGAVDVQMRLLVGSLRRMREARGLTQRDVHQLTGINQCTLSFIENSKQEPTLRVLLALCELYDVPLAMWEPSDAAA